jgi:glycosyltransferase involved in cell wall biosynthesis
VGGNPQEAGRPAVSVVLPVHNERESLAPLLEEVRAALRGRAFEIVAVDDASTDGSGDELARLARGATDLRVLRLRRRSGQSAALAAGWTAARAPIVVTLDADGQNDPADIPALLAALDADPSLGAVVGVRTGRRDGRWKRLQSTVANRVRDTITGHRVTDTACGLKVMRRDPLLRLPRFDGMHRFLPTLLVREGVAVREHPVAHRPRRYGRTKYGMWNRAFRGLRDAFGIRWLTRRALPADWDEVPRR